MKCSQKISVKGNRLSFWERGGHGRWECVLECYCGHGRNGFSLSKEEGDGCTPLGVFPLIMTFGFSEKALGGLPYRKIGPESYWSGEEVDYNRWVEVPAGTRSMSRSEHLEDYPVQYKYSAVIGYNTSDPEWGAGSAIFFHCKGPAGWPTAGCISAPEDAVRLILSRCTPGALIQIVP